MEKEQKSREENLNELHVPFEWLTNFSTLAPHLNPSKLFPTENGDGCETIHPQQLQVLHIGCGSSTLGEMLLQTFDRFHHVINVDVDVETLLGMKKRWLTLVEKWNRVNGSSCDTLPQLSFAYMDFQSKHQKHVKGLDDVFESNSQKFDLILDKSTLDCLLCSDDGAAGLICKVYQHLKVNGVYFLISFHQVHFIKRLLEDCPGASWSIEHFTVERRVDSPAKMKQQESLLYKDVNLKFDSRNDSLVEESNTVVLEDVPSATWKDGSFAPDDEYRRVVNVFVCRRHRSDQKTTDNLDYASVVNHIHEVNDEYFKEANPLVTHVRTEQLKSQFEHEMKINMLGEDDDCNLTSFVLSLEGCYRVLFTEAEKEHLTFEYFMEDYEAYCEENEYEQRRKNGMTLDEAVRFLKAMQ